MRWGWIKERGPWMGLTFNYNMGRITTTELDELKQSLGLLVGVKFNNLTLPVEALGSFEPSQIGTIVGTLVDAMIPRMSDDVGLSKCERENGDRESYPDYKHSSEKRVELKLLYVDNPELKIKKPQTKREPSARLTEKVTTKNVDPKKDAMLLLAYRIERNGTPTTASPKIIDLGVFSMIELIEARDERMMKKGGRWFGDCEVPVVLSKKGKKKLKKNQPLDTSSYGHKESEGKDLNKDTNFGKLNRIPHKKLQAFIAKQGGKKVRYHLS